MVPKFASSVDPGSFIREAVPMQIGLVRLGGISANLGLLDSGYRETIAIATL